MFVFKKENQIFWILCEAWVSESLSASKITCGHLHFKSTKGSYVEILLNGIMGTWLPRNDLYPAQVDTYSELGMLRCKHHVLTPFWELAHVYIVPWGQQKSGCMWKNGILVPDGQGQKRPSILTWAVSHDQCWRLSWLSGLTLGWPHCVHSELTSWVCPAALLHTLFLLVCSPGSNTLSSSYFAGVLSPSWGCWRTVLFRFPFFPT